MSRTTLPIYPLLGEIHAMVAKADTPRDRMLVLLLWHTGGRISEVLNIRVGDITPTGIRMINLKQSELKEKHVFLHPDFRKELAAYCRGMPSHAFLIGRYGDGGRICRKHGWELFKTMALRAGVLRQRQAKTKNSPRPPVEAVWPHTARHGYAVNMLSQQIPITAVQAQLGHSSLASTQIYAQLTDPQRERMIAGARF